MFWIILYGILAFIAATLTLISFFEEDDNPVGDQWIMYIAGTLIFGVCWPISIWISLVRWYVTKDTPTWIKAVREFFNLFMGKK